MATEQDRRGEGGVSPVLIFPELDPSPPTVPQGFSDLEGAPKPFGAQRPVPPELLPQFEGEGRGLAQFVALSVAVEQQQEDSEQEEGRKHPSYHGTYACQKRAHETGSEAILATGK